jgi:hypothetical protein
VVVVVVLAVVVVFRAVVDKHHLMDCLRFNFLNN